MNRASERRLLQCAVAVLALVPLLAGGGGALLGLGFVDAAGDVSADSHLRYLSGLLLAVGAGFWSTVPRIEAHGARFRLLTGIVLLGGLARAYGAFQLGWPAGPMLFGLAMELVVTPALCVWQGRVARRYAGADMAVSRA